MVEYPKSPNFLKHTENLNAVRGALTQVERVHKRAIREGDEPAEQAMRKPTPPFLACMQSHASARSSRTPRDSTSESAS